MPLFHFINNHGKKERIFPLHFSDLTGFVIVETQNSKQLRVHKDCIITENTELEIKEARKKFLDQQYANIKKEDK